LTIAAYFGTQVESIDLSCPFICRRGACGDSRAGRTLQVTGFSIAPQRTSGIASLNASVAPAVFLHRNVLLSMRLEALY